MRVSEIQCLSKIYTERRFTPCVENTSKSTALASVRLIRQTKVHSGTSEGAIVSKVAITANGTPVQFPPPAAVDICLHGLGGAAHPLQIYEKLLCQQCIAFCSVEDLVGHEDLCS